MWHNHWVFVGLWLTRQSHILVCLKCCNADFNHVWQCPRSDGTCCGVSSVRCTAVWRASMPSWRTSWRRWDRTTSSWSGSTTTWSRPARSWGGCMTMTRERWLRWGCCTSRYLWNWQPHPHSRLYSCRWEYINQSTHTSSHTHFHPHCPWDSIIWILTFETKINVFLSQWPSCPRRQHHSEKWGQTGSSPHVSHRSKHSFRLDKWLNLRLFLFHRRTFCLTTVRRSHH